MPRLIINKGKEFYTELILPDQDILTIGRAEANDIVLPDPSLQVSRHHAAIIRLADTDVTYFVRDLASLQATRVNGQVVRQHRLRERDTIEIGDYALQYSDRVRTHRTWQEGNALISVRKDRQQSGESLVSGPAQEKTTLAAPEDSPEMLLRLPEQREVAEVLLKKLQSDSTLIEVFDHLMEPVLRVLPADRGFVGLFRGTDSEDYQGVGLHGFDPRQGERIEVEDAEFLQRLQDGKVIHERSTLLVPFFLLDGGRGFFCVDRRRPARSFLPDDIQFLSILIQILKRHERIRARERTPLQPTVNAPGLLAWPKTIVGSRKRLQNLFKQIDGAASRNIPVLILGETGTGKGVVAHQIHKKSKRQGEFVNVNLPSIPKDLAESELFGHKKGAFTGAIEDKPGRFELADKGTLFLDEIGVLSKEVQVKLLKPVHEREITRLGEGQPRSVDVRIIAATNKDLINEIAQGNFADDLYQRLRPIEIRLPPLRERREDIPLLVHYFLDKYAQQEGNQTCEISRTALQRLSEYQWPGNIRELEGYIQAAVAPNKEVLFSWDFSSEIQQVTPALGEQKPEGKVSEDEKEHRRNDQQQTKKHLKSLAEVEREHIYEVLEYTKGNKTRACEILGCSRTTLLKKLNKKEDDG